MNRRAACRRAGRHHVLLNAALLAAAAVSVLGCGGDGDDRPDGGELIGEGNVQRTELATGRVSPGRIVDLEDGTTQPGREGTEDGSKPASATLAGAERIGGGGTIHPNVAPEQMLEAATLEDIDLHEATAVAIDGDGGVWILVQGEPGTGRRPIAHGHASTAMRVQGNKIDVVRKIPAGSQASMLTARTGRDVEVGVHGFGESDVTVLARDQADDHVIEVRREDLVQVGALALTDDGAVLAGRTDRARIDAFAADGGVRHLLGFSGFDPDAEVQLDEPLGGVESLVALSGDRVAFVAGGRDGRVLRLLDRDEVRTVDPIPRDDRREIHTIGPAPDGRLLAVAAGSETHPQIHVIDVETGETEVIADLEGAMQHADGPRGISGALWSVAAATDGDDLVFLADGYLWRLSDVFG